MNRQRILPYIGLSLLVVCFAIALTRVFRRGGTTDSDGRTVVTFTHWQLESGLREAMDQLARDYEKLHPDVHIKQIPVPERVYAQWMRTQLIGETASDIIELGQGLDEEMLARFFLPLTEYVEQPNPYNAGTDLANTRWRETFTDGMIAGWNYRPALLEYYGIPLSMFTIRVFYNEGLWKQILGDTPIPTDYDAFIDICHRVEAYAQTTGKPIISIAGSKYNGPNLIDRFFGNQTQRLSYRIAPLSNLRTSAVEAATTFIRGDWTIDDPGYESALEISREIGLTMQPGYPSLGREDAAFYFIQGRALMITTGSWDSPSLRSQATFPISVFEVPLPTKDHPRYGKNLFGPPSEAETTTGFSFGITRDSHHTDIALDFLRYITSRSANTTFSEVSGWLPSVVGVKPPKELIPFIPRTDGYVNGFVANLGLQANTRRVIEAATNRLVGTSGSVAQFKDTIRESFPQAIRDDLVRINKNSLINIDRQDTFRAAQYVLKELGTNDAETAKVKISKIEEGQNIQEGDRSWVEYELATHPAR